MSIRLHPSRNGWKKISAAETIAGRAFNVLNSVYNKNLQENIWQSENTAAIFVPVL